MKRLIVALLICLTLGITQAQAAYIDCSGLPSSHTVTVNVKLASDGSSIVAGAATTERAGTQDSNYFYNFTGETAGITYSIECLDATDATNNFSWTLSGRETYIDASVKLITDKLPTNYIMGSSVQTAKDDEIDSIVSHLIIRQKAISDASPTTLKFDTTLTEANDNYWNNAAILFTSGVNVGQIRAIKDYDGTAKEITLNTALVNAPSNGDTFSIIMTRAFKLAGLEAQEIRDAMKLDASVGAPASGSIDKHLDDIPTNPTLQTTWTDAKAGYLTGAVALDSTVAKEATLANATYGLSALKTLIDAIGLQTIKLRFNNFNDVWCTTHGR